MYFQELVGQKKNLAFLKRSVDEGRIPHAQLFVGKTGFGSLHTAIAYAAYIICKEHANPDKCYQRVIGLQHPDLHFAFPVAANEKVKKHPVSNLFMEDWREFIHRNPYASIFDWYKQLHIENKQGKIGVEEAQEIVKALQLKPYEATNQVMIIWMPEKMNTPAANKLLKLIEEPPKNTVLLLVTEQEDQIINTIRSRCQVLHFHALSAENISSELQKKFELTPDEAIAIAKRADGDLNKAIQFVEASSDESTFEEWFVHWIRAAFRAKGNPSVINDLIQWSRDIASKGRETQKEFLQYCIQVFRQALLINYEAEELVYYSPYSDDFKLENFAPFIHGGNIMEIATELNDAIYHIERNANAKVVLLDLSIKLTRFLHIKQEA